MTWCLPNVFKSAALTSGGTIPFSIATFNSLGHVLNVVTTYSELDMCLYKARAWGESKASAYRCGRRRRQIKEVLPTEEERSVSSHRDIK